MKIPKPIQAALDACGKPYTVETGARHIKIRVNGAFCGILPLAGAREGRAMKNVTAQIRRAAQGLAHNRRTG